MDIATPTPRCRFPVSLLFLIFIHTACENISGNSHTINIPSVTSTYPENNATGVAVHAPITATFSDIIDPVTISDTTFFVRSDTNKVEGTHSYTDSTITFWPARSLAFEQAYTATITTHLRTYAGSKMDQDYSWTFTTAGNNKTDTTPPSVLSTTPQNNAEGVSIQPSISALFNEPLNPATINSNTFVLMQGSNPIPTNITSTDTTIEMILISLLEFETTYTVFISEAIQDTAGNALGNTFSWNFTTGQENIPLRVTRTSPRDGEKRVALETVIMVEFSEAMDADTINKSSFIISTRGNVVSGEIHNWGHPSRFFFIPSDDLKPDRNYAVQITTEVQDLAGNALNKNYTWGFSTKFKSNDKVDDD